MLLVAAVGLVFGLSLLKEIWTINLRLMIKLAAKTDNKEKMISFLSGKIIYKSINKVEIDVSGVGYEVFVSASDLLKINVNDDVKIFTYHQIAEDKSDLYGFLDRKDKRVFEMLLSVSGIGPKTALNIFSIASGEKILTAISKADVNFFKQVKGLGGKGGQRIIVDLKSKVGSVEELDFNLESSDETICQALLSLGFTRYEARNVLANIPAELKTEDEKIKYALRQLGRK